MPESERALYIGSKKGLGKISLPKPQATSRLYSSQQFAMGKSAMFENVAESANNGAPEDCVIPEGKLEKSVTREIELKPYRARNAERKEGNFLATQFLSGSPSPLQRCVSDVSEFYWIATKQRRRPRIQRSYACANKYANMARQTQIDYKAKQCTASMLSSHTCILLLLFGITANLCCGA